MGERAQGRPARAVAPNAGSRHAARQEIADRFEEHVCGVDPNRGSARTWLMSITNNLLIDHYRRDRSTSQKPIEEHLSRRELITVDSNVGLSPDLTRAPEQLGERERELVAASRAADQAAGGHYPFPPLPYPYGWAACESALESAWARRDVISEATGAACEMKEGLRADRFLAVSWTARLGAPEPSYPIRTGAVEVTDRILPR